MSHARLIFGGIVCLALMMTGRSATAGAITFDVKATVDGAANTKIGSIEASFSYSVADGFVEIGVFTLNAIGAALDFCYDFRWYQIITGIPEDIRTDDQTKFKDKDGDYTVSPVVPFVDPPAGGYKYQEAAGGADRDPFYENTDPGVYFFPNFSARHTEGVESITDDNPGPEDVLFETYLVAIGHNIPPKQFLVLAGYSWQTTLEAGVPAQPDPLQISSPFAMATLNDALHNSGFKAADYNNFWLARDDLKLEHCVPEPSSLFIYGIALVGCGFHRRRPKTAGGQAA